MAKLKVALLEDNKVLLKDLKELVEETGLVDVVAFATSSQEFLDKIKSQKPDAILLDIDLGGDTMTGIDVAHHAKLPVLFVSGKTKDFYKGIEELNIYSDMPIEHITKPITQEKLQKLLPKFIKQINSLQQNIKVINSEASQFIILETYGSMVTRIKLSEIAYISTCDDDKSHNDKNIYTTTGKIHRVVEKKLEQLIELLPPSNFMRIGRYTIVAKSAIEKHSKNYEEIYLTSVLNSKSVQLNVAPSVKEDFISWYLDM